MRAVDTNLLVRLLVRDDLKQLAAAERFVSSGAWVSHLVLAEALGVLDSVFDRQPSQIADAVRMLLEHDTLVIQDADCVAAALEHFLKRPALGFSDCLILEIARKAGHLPLGTFDRDLAKLAGAQKA
jgi:predicted nucleic-acid-binding protein